MNAVPGPLRSVLAALLLILASVSFVTVQTLPHTKTSPVDEYMYIDYLAKFPEQGIITRGEDTGTFAREYISCHGVLTRKAPDMEYCAAGDFSDPDRFSRGGKSSADIYTPLYFGATWAMSQPILATTDLDIVQAGRLTGAVWMAGAALFLFGAIRRLGMNRVTATAVPLLMVGSLPAWWSATYLSTDVTLFTFGAALAYLLVRHLADRRWGWSALILATSVLGILVKLQNLMATAVVAVALLLTAAHDARAPRTPGVFRRLLRDRFTWIAVSAVGLSLAAQLAWMKLRPVMPDAPPPAQSLKAPLTPFALLSETYKFLPNLMNGARNPFTHFGGWGVFLVLVVGWLIVIAVLVQAITARERTERTLARALLITAILGGPALALATALAEGYYFALPARYALGLIPFALLIVAQFCAGRRWSERALVGLGAGAFTAAMLMRYTGPQ